MQRGRVRVVDAEANEHVRHLLHVALHALPKLRRVSLALSEAQLHQVFPYHDAPSQVVELLRDNEVSLRVLQVLDPAVVGREISVVKLREISRKKLLLLGNPGLLQLDLFVHH